MNTKAQQRIAASIRDQMLDARLGLITTAQWIERYDAAEAQGVEMDLATRTRRANLRGVQNALEVEFCFVCGGVNDEGDEPGYGLLEGGGEVPLCSVACTEAFFATDDAVEV